MGCICLARTKIPDHQGFHIKHITRTVGQRELILSGKGGNPGKPRFLT